MALAELGDQHWVNAPVRHEVHGPSDITIVAGPRTDLFCDPGGDEPVGNAPMLLGTLDGDHQFSATVGLDLVSDFDAAALVLYADPSHWAKLAFELSPRGRPTIVTVVTNGVSDDANAMEVTGDAVDLRISRIGDSHAFHVRRDGEYWELVRYFSLPGPGEVGLLSQSPIGDGVQARFTNVRVVDRRLVELRDGT